MPYSQLHKTQPASRKGSEANTKAILEGLRLGIFTVNAETGKIFNSKGYELKQTPNFFGYPQISIRVGIPVWKFFVHKVVWISKNGPVAPDFEIDHIDGNKLHPYIGNLQILHWRQNMAKTAKACTPLQTAF